MQKKGKPASVCIQTGALWAQSSLEEIQVCKNSAGRFSRTADSACAARLHLCLQLSLQAWHWSVKSLFTMSPLTLILLHLFIDVFNWSSDLLIGLLNSLNKLEQERKVHWSLTFKNGQLFKWLNRFLVKPLLLQSFNRVYCVGSRIKLDYRAHSFICKLKLDYIQLPASYISLQNAFWCKINYLDKNVWWWVAAVPSNHHLSWKSEGHLVLEGS